MQRVMQYLLQDLSAGARRVCWKLFVPGMCETAPGTVLVPVMPSASRFARDSPAATLSKGAWICAQPFVSAGQTQPSVLLGYIQARALQGWIFWRSRLKAQVLIM